MTVSRITKRAAEAMEPGGYLWDTDVVGFGARRQTRGVFYILRFRADLASSRPFLGQEKDVSFSLYRKELFKLFEAIQRNTWGKPDDTVGIPPSGLRRRQIAANN